MAKKYFIGTGWYSVDGPRSYGTEGDDLQRSQNFSHIWLNSIDRFFGNYEIVCVNSASPLPWPIENYPGTYLYTLPENNGHSRVKGPKFCGWSISVILSLTSFMSSKCEHYFYVEQDVLLKGSVEGIRSQLSGDVVLGNRDKSFPIQQSFFYVSKHAAASFLSKFIGVNGCDYEVPPELKFVVATQVGLKYYLVKLLIEIKLSKTLKIRLVNYLMHLKLIQLATWSFGYGRSRPLSFDDEILYFQHGEKDEIQKFINRVINAQE